MDFPLHGFFMIQNFFDSFGNWWMEKFCGEASHESKQSMKTYQNISFQDSQSAISAKVWL